MTKKKHHEDVKPLKPYATPTLRELGTVHMTTQGTGGQGNDSGLNMTMTMT